ncbi:metallophosphoesterase 1 [Tanacetum coccineum]
MMLKRIILFIFTFIYIFYDNWIPTPSCIQQQQHDNLQEEDNDLKVMMVSDLMLSGGSSSSSGYGSYLDLLDLYFKDYYFSRFFTILEYAYNVFVEMSELKRQWSYKFVYICKFKRKLVEILAANNKKGQTALHMAFYAGFSGFISVDCGIVRGLIYIDNVIEAKEMHQSWLDMRLICSEIDASMISLLEEAFLPLLYNCGGKYGMPAETMFYILAKNRANP